MGLSVYLAPLAGITDTAMRQICLEYGDCLTFTEMISVNGLFYNNSRTKDLLHIAKGEETVGSCSAAMLIPYRRWPALRRKYWENVFVR